jgi:NADH:ubiquinone reductase (H+-translocating)
MNLVVVGGGPTGTEVAGALAEMKKHIFPKEYSELDIDKIRIVLIEAAPALLGGMSVRSSSTSERYLKKLGVEVMTGVQVKDYENDAVLLEHRRTHSHA